MTNTIAGGNLAQILQGRDLSNMDFSGANLKNANFDSSNLSGAKFVLGADLSGASFANANVKDANFSDANLAGADLSKSKNLNDAKGLQFGKYDKTKVTRSQAATILRRMQASGKHSSMGEVKRMFVVV